MPSLNKRVTPESPMNTTRSPNGCIALEVLMRGEQWQGGSSSGTFGGKHFRTNGDSRKVLIRGLSMSLPRRQTVAYSPLGMMAANSRRGRLSRNTCMESPRYFSRFSDPSLYSQIKAFVVFGARYC